MSIIVHKKISGNSKESILEAVRKSMELANWKKYVKGKSVFLKVNLLVKTVIPSQCTSS